MAKRSLQMFKMLSSGHKTKIPIDIQPKSYFMKDRELCVTWDHENHESVYDIDWLLKIRNIDKKSKQIVTWDSNLSDHLPTTRYKDVINSDSGLLDWLSNIGKFGIGFVSDVPVDSEKTKDLCKRISVIRETHYGGFWQFTSDLEHGDLAYTNAAIAPHTDTTYFTSPSGLQIFHLLEHVNGTGGTSIWVDGFQCAQKFLSQSPEAYEVLSRIRIPYLCCGDQDLYISPTPDSFPVLNHDPETNELIQIRYNNDDRAPMTKLSHSETQLFYKSLREWDSIVNDPRNQIRLNLRPGLVVALNNWRVLHGRTAFTGKRTMCGCYIDYDYFKGRLNAKLEIS